MTKPTGSLEITIPVELLAPDAGLCECGCGRSTPISDRTNARLGYVKGEPYRYARGHNRYAGERSPYRRVSGNNAVREHVAVAERALGHAMPAGAVVHHVNGDGRDNSPSNLVICQDQAYHALLHRRALALRECGHADWLWCFVCKQHRPAELVRLRSGKANGRCATCRKRATAASRVCLQCFRPMEGNACFCPKCEATRYPEPRR